MLCEALHATGLCFGRRVLLSGGQRHSYLVQSDQCHRYPLLPHRLCQLSLGQRDGESCLSPSLSVFSLSSLAQAYRAAIGDSIISSFDQVIDNGRLVVYLCVKVPKAAAVRAESDVCNSASQDSCASFAFQAAGTTGGSAAALAAPLLLLAALLAVLL